MRKEFNKNVENNRESGTTRLDVFSQNSNKETVAEGLKIEQQCRDKIAKLITKHRNRRGFDQDTLANIIRVPIERIQAYENAKLDIELMDLMHLSQVFGYEFSNAINKLNEEFNASVGVLKLSEEGTKF